MTQQQTDGELRRFVYLVAVLPDAFSDVYTLEVIASDEHDATRQAQRRNREAYGCGCDVRITTRITGRNKSEAQVRAIATVALVDLEEHYGHDVAITRTEAESGEQPTALSLDCRTCGEAIFGIDKLARRSGGQLLRTRQS
jgi:hypothetical protein